MRVIIDSFVCSECGATVGEGIYFKFSEDYKDIHIVCKECIQKALDMLDE